MGIVKFAHGLRLGLMQRWCLPDQLTICNRFIWLQ
jgi:hypothetical protein